MGSGDTLVPLRRQDCTGEADVIAGWQYSTIDLAEAHLHVHVYRPSIDNAINDFSAVTDGESYL